MIKQNICDRFVAGLRLAQAMERETLSLMDRQIQPLANYAGVKSRLRRHRGR